MIYFLILYVIGSVIGVIFTLRFALQYSYNLDDEDYTALICAGFLSWIAVGIHLFIILMEIHDDKKKNI